MVISRVIALLGYASLAVAQDAAIRVSVVNGLGNRGQFRAGYDVWAVRADCRESFRAVTAVGGTATLEIPAGEYSIYASGADIGVMPVEVSVQRREDRHLELTALAAAEDTAGKPLFRPWRIVVIDQERKPVEGARVEMIMRGRRNPSGFVQVHSTDPRGEVNLCREKGEVAQITVSHDGFGTAKHVVRYEEASRPIEIRIRRQAPPK